MMAIARPGQELLLISEDGLAKRSNLTKFPTQGRRGKGVLAWKSGEDVSIVGGAIGEQKDRAVIRFNRGAPRSVRFSDAPRRARTSSGNPLFEMKDGTRIIVVSPALPRPNIQPPTPTSKTPSRKKRVSASSKKTSSTKKKSSTVKKKATRSSKA
jgi:DNA gyrase subunit A